MNGPINSGLITADYDTRGYPHPERVKFRYVKKVVPTRPDQWGFSGRSIQWSGVVTFSPVALRDFDMYVLRGGGVAGYISMVPNVYGYQYGWALTDNYGNLLDIGICRKAAQRWAISYLPSAAEQKAYHEGLQLATRRDAQLMAAE